MATNLICITMCRTQTTNTAYNTREATLLQSLTNTIIHYKYQVFATFNSMKQHSYEKKTFKPSVFGRSIQSSLKCSKGHIFFFFPFNEVIILFILITDNFPYTIDSA